MTEPQRMQILPQQRASNQQASQSSAVDQSPISELDIGEYREQDRFLPVSVLSLESESFHGPHPLTEHQIANVSRIMKAAVPPSTKIGKDAKECVQECVSEFISFITSEAAERSLVEKRKTIGGEDILYAMNSLGFDNYAEVLKIYLAKLREHQTSSANTRASDPFIEPRSGGRV
ncbi:nuclear transcription factor Y subunit B-1 [Favolaschia claudopus]|uniref:Nuclear transcription factor Y subunit B-1 n=1 Tax=Favolaschia claudopus TaxID=2862362 RepID=A0AAV9ZF42_9AGAR